MYHFRTRYDRYWLWHDLEVRRQAFSRLLADSPPHPTGWVLLTHYGWWN